MIYVLVYFLSIIFVFLAQHEIRRNRKAFFLFYSFISLSILFITASFRDIGIGTDTNAYVRTVWEKVISISNIEDLLKTYNSGDFFEIEFVYVLTCWLSSLVSADIHFLFLVLNILAILPIYLAIYENRHKCSMCLAFATFLLLYYDNTLNLVRQSVALSFSVYSFSLFKLRKYTKCAIYCILAFLFHGTSLFFLLFVYLYYIYTHASKLWRNIIMKSTYVLFILLYFNFDKFLYYIIETGILPTKYAYYAVEMSETGFSGMTVLRQCIILLLIYICIYYANKKKLQKEITRRLKCYLILKTWGIFLFLSSLISMWAFRVSFYFNYPIDIVLFPKAMIILKKSRYYNILIFFYFVILFFIWYWTVIRLQMNEVYPYKSQILGIK